MANGRNEERFKEHLNNDLAISKDDLKAHTASVAAQISRHTDEMKAALANEKQTLEEGLQKRVEDARSVIDGQRWTVTTVLSILAAFAIGAAYLFGTEFSQLEDSLTTEVQAANEQVVTSLKETIDELNQLKGEVDKELLRFGDIQQQKLAEITTRVDAEFERFSSLQEVQRLTVPSIVRSVIFEDGQTAERVADIWSTIEPQLAEIDGLNRRYAAVLSNAGVVIGEFGELPYSINEAYRQLAGIEEFAIESDEPLPEDQRVRVAALISTMISESIERAVDPNTIFNASVAASRLGFFDEAIKLATLADVFQPIVTHKIMRLEREAASGVAYHLQDGKFARAKTEPARLREIAWEEMLSIVRELPRQDSEQVFSRAWNVALRNNSLGYYDDLIRAIEAGLEATPERATSYVHALLAQLYANRAGPNWRAEYFRALNQAVLTFLNEPKTATWYEHSLSEMLETAKQLGFEVEIVKIFEENGL